MVGVGNDVERIRPLCFDAGWNWVLGETMECLSFSGKLASLEFLTLRAGLLEDPGQGVRCAEIGQTRLKVG